MMRVFASLLLLLFVGRVESSCSSDIKLLSQKGATTYGELPIEIISQDTSTVQFGVRQTWVNENSVNNIYVQYRSDAAGTESCSEFKAVAPSQIEEFTAFCSTTVPQTVIEISVSDTSFDPVNDDAKVNQCCQVPETDIFPKVKYIFVLQCVTTCDEDESMTLPLPSGGSAAETKNLPSPFGGSEGDTVQLQTTTCEESVIMTEQPHNSTTADDQLELTVHITDTEIYDRTGYQPQVVLFLAKPDATIEDVTTDDEGWSYFESQVVSWMKGKIHCCLSTTYFYAKTLDEDTNQLVEQQTSSSTRMENNAAMRIRRSNGQMTYWFSMDGGTSWEQVGEAMTLPAEYQTGPLKIGYRIKREYHCEYNISTIPYVISGGPVEYTGPTISASYFDDTNSLTRNSVDFGDGIVTFSSDIGLEQALLLSQETFQDDVSIQVQLTERRLFGENKYQSGLWLFFVPESISDLDALDMRENPWDTGFRDLTIGAVGDKVFNNGGETTWFNTYALQLDGTIFSGSDTDQYTNLDGYLRLERHQGFIQAFKSPNGAGWQPIDDLIQLPEEWRYAGIRVGLGIKTNWNADYYISFLPTIDTNSVDLSRIEAYSAPTPAPTPATTHGEVAITRNYNPSYFTDANSITTTRVAFEEDYIRYSNDLGSDHSLLISQETFSNDVSVTVEVLYRQLFGANKYQGGLWLFFADPTADVETLFATDDPCDWEEFQNATIATFGDKVHGSIVHTWMNTHILASDDTFIEQSGSVSYRNVEGNLKLERSNGFVSAYVQNDGDASWQAIGDPVELPDEWKTAPVKIGIALRENYNADYQVAFSTTVVREVSAPSRGRRGLLRGQNTK